MFLNIGFWGGRTTPKTKPPIFYFLFFLSLVFGVAGPLQIVHGRWLQPPLGQNGVASRPTPFLFLFFNFFLIFLGF
jgi:hypothetical protein